MDYFNFNATESSKHAVGFPVRGSSLVHMNGHILADGRLVAPIFLPLEPHKASAEVSNIGHIQERLLVVSHGLQSKSTDGSWLACFSGNMKPCCVHRQQRHVVTDSWLGFSALLEQLVKLRFCLLLAPTWQEP